MGQQEENAHQSQEISQNLVRSKGKVGKTTKKRYELPQI
jgi:hypothetical protein